MLEKEDWKNGGDKKIDVLPTLRERSRTKKISREPTKWNKKNFKMDSPPPLFSRERDI
jgi:hypothetical protein